MSGLRIKRISTYSELDSLESVWKDFENLENGTSIFQSWLWNRTWCDHFLGDNASNGLSLDVRVVEDESGRIHAILPFFRQSVAGPFVQLVQFLGHRMSCYNDVLFADPENPKLADEVVRLLLEDLGSNQILHLRQMHSESNFSKILVRNGLAERQCEYLFLRSDPNITDQRVRLGRSTRKNLRSCENQLRRRFEVCFAVKSGEDFSHAFDQLVSLHNLRFHEKNVATIYQGPSLVFLKEIMTNLSSTENSEILELRVNDTTIAAMLMVRDCRRYFFMQSGFDPTYSQYSPMRLLITEAIRRGFDDLQCEVFDFGPGFEGYKYYWSPIRGENVMSCTSGTGAGIRVVAALYKILFRYNLPPSPPEGVKPES